MNVMSAIRARRSIRNYRPVPLSNEHARILAEAAARSGPGPFGATCRCKLLRPTPENPGALKGLTGLVGTYGFITNAQAFLVGATGRTDHALEDFGYSMQGLVLQASALGVGSCWLGGAFRRRRFAAAMGLTPGESVPAVVSLGYDAGRRRLLIDTAIEQHHCYRQARRARDSMFFGNNTFGAPLERADVGAYADALEAVSLAPSSCNTQTWRIVRASEQVWHLFFERSVRYSKKDQLAGNADLQRIDMGIAMCHFEAVARERGRAGAWRALPGVRVFDLPRGVEYVASWSEAPCTA